MANPGAFQLVGTITDRDGRELRVLTDYGDVMLDSGGLASCWRLSPAHVVQLEWVLSQARLQADRLEAERIAREAQ